MIKSFDYLPTLKPIEAEIIQAITRVLHSGRLILGPETEAFEIEFAQFVGVKHCVAVSSGTTALHVALSALGIGRGDEVITVANTCVPTAAAIRLAGAEPVFVDIREDDLMMSAGDVQRRIGPRTRCILPVHLWGQCANLSELAEVARQHRLDVVEDCSQAHGTLCRGQHVGTFGRVGCFSFYPTKNLGSYGDAGAVVTNDDGLGEKLRALRTYGYDKEGIAQFDGMNARISEMQAAVLRTKLRHLPKWLQARRRNAATYYDGLRHAALRLPSRQLDVTPSYHQFVVRCARRQALIDHLHSQQIQTGIHYAVPIHRMPPFRIPYALPVTEAAAQEVVSLPVHESLRRVEVQFVVDTINNAPPGIIR